MTKEQPGQWPSWPAGSAGTVMVDVLVESLSVDELFLLVHGGETEFRVSRLYCSPFGRRHKSSQRRWSAAPTVGVHMARRRNAEAVCPAARPSARPVRPQKKCNEALSNKDYATTPWLPSDEEAERWSGAAAPLQAADLPSLRPPLFRRATYSSTAMGVKVRVVGVVGAWRQHTASSAGGRQRALGCAGVRAAGGPGKSGVPAWQGMPELQATPFS